MTTTIEAIVAGANKLADSSLETRRRFLYEMGGAAALLALGILNGGRLNQASGEGTTSREMLLSPEFPNTTPTSAELLEYYRLNALRLPRLDEIGLADRYDIVAVPAPALKNGEPVSWFDGTAKEGGWGSVAVYEMKGSQLSFLTQLNPGRINSMEPVITVGATLVDRGKAMQIGGYLTDVSGGKGIIEFSPNRTTRIVIPSEDNLPVIKIMHELGVGGFLPRTKRYEEYMLDKLTMARARIIARVDPQTRVVERIAFFPRIVRE